MCCLALLLNRKATIELLVEKADEIGFNRFTILNLHALLGQPAGQPTGRRPPAAHSDKRPRRGLPSNRSTAAHRGVLRALETEAACGRRTPDVTATWR